MQERVEKSPAATIDAQFPRNWQPAARFGPSEPAIRPRMRARMDSFNTLGGYRNERRRQASSGKADYRIVDEAGFRCLGIATVSICDARVKWNCVRLALHGDEVLDRSATWLAA